MFSGSIALIRKFFIREVLKSIAFRSALLEKNEDIEDIGDTVFTSFIIAA